MRLLLLRCHEKHADDMKTRLIILSLLSLSAAVPVFSQNEYDAYVSLDNTFSDMLFKSGTGNVTGADGAISIPLSKDSTLFLWGDSFYGDVNNNTRPTTSPFISGNAMSLVTPEGARTITSGTPEAPEAFLSTDPKDGYRAVLWPEHGVAKNGILHLFYADIAFTGTATFDFFWHSVDYYRISLKDFSVIGSRNFSFDDLAGIHLGFGCIEDGDYVYVYGTRLADGKNCLYLCRMKMSNDELGDLEFWSYDKWTKNPTLATRLGGDITSMSEQFSVFKYGDKFVLLTQERAGKDIYTYVADRPWGPWLNEKKIYSTPEAGLKEGWITYNAMAHPQYIKDGKLPVSYCVNTLDLKQLYSDVTSYRPRFLWVNLDYILKK
jgi:hypothetical protein